MKAARLLAVLIMAGVMLAYGCAGKRPAPAPRPASAAPTAPTAPAAPAQPPAAAQLPTGAKPDLDVNVLPPPRTEPAATPDLSNAVYAINADTLGAMADNGVPADVVDSLRKLDGKTYSNTAVFLAAAKDAAGEAALEQHQEAILRNALVVTLAEAPAAPRGQASLDESAAGSQVVQMLTTPLVQRATDFKIVYFDFDNFDIKPEYVATIREKADRLVSSKQAVVIEGHCDERGTNEYNLALGQRRAEAVRQALLADGVPAGQLKTISYGEERPVDPGHNEAAWAKNRRAVLRAQ